MRKKQKEEIFLTAADGEPIEPVGDVRFVGDDVCLDPSVGDAVVRLGLIGALRQIRAAGALQAGGPAQSQVLSSDLYNKKRYDKPKPAKPR